MTGLIFFGQTLSPRIIIALAAVLLIVAIIIAMTYGPTNPPQT